ncbi:Patj-like [Papilio machaon]|uniref:Patj-like n=1 Tax=Papilio machaon TaxID=76193 RepID=A0A0N0PAW9_PAPMA|nr:Patj-like [Papilio machaon]
MVAKGDTVYANVYLVVVIQQVFGEWAQVEVVELVNDGSGLAFGIVGGRSSGVVVKSVLPGGVADRKNVPTGEIPRPYRRQALCGGDTAEVLLYERCYPQDGRLRSGDMLLRIGAVSVVGMCARQAAAVLRQCGACVRLLVARPASAALPPSMQEVRALKGLIQSIKTVRNMARERFFRGVLSGGIHSGGGAAGSTRPRPAPPATHNRTQPVASIVAVVPRGALAPAPRPPPLIIAPPEPQPPPMRLPLDMAVRGGREPETLSYEVQLNKHSALGLGITVAGYVCEQEELSGIFVKSVSAGSAADLCGKIQVNDRIVEVDGVSLHGVTNHKAVSLLRDAKGPIVRLKALSFLANHKAVSLLRDAKGPIVRLKALRYLRGAGFEKLQKALAAQDGRRSPVAPPSPSVTSLAKYSFSVYDESTVIEAEAESEIRHLPSPTSPGEEAEIVIGREDDISERELRRIQDKWRDILREEKDWPGHQHQYDIVVGTIMKEKDSGLGISLEGTVRVVGGKEVQARHYIRAIAPNGPVAKLGTYKVGDELLEVNGWRVLGSHHVEVVTRLRAVTSPVLLVCVRKRQEENKERENSFSKSAIIGGSLQDLLIPPQRLIKAKSESSVASLCSAATVMSAGHDHDEDVSCWVISLSINRSNRNKILLDRLIECVNSIASDDHTGMDSFHECLQEYGEGLEVVQICLEPEEASIKDDELSALCDLSFDECKRNQKESICKDQLDKEKVNGITELKSSKSEESLDEPDDDMTITEDDVLVSPRELNIRSKSADRKEANGSRSLSKQNSKDLSTSDEMVFAVTPTGLERISFEKYWKDCGENKEEVLEKVKSDESWKECLNSPTDEASSFYDATTRISVQEENNTLLYIDHEIDGYETCLDDDSSSVKCAEKNGYKINGDREIKDFSKQNEVHRNKDNDACAKTNTDQNIVDVVDDSSYTRPYVQEHIIKQMKSLRIEPLNVNISTKKIRKKSPTKPSKNERRCIEYYNDQDECLKEIRMKKLEEEKRHKEERKRTPKKTIAIEKKMMLKKQEPSEESTDLENNYVPDCHKCFLENYAYAITKAYIAEATACKFCEVIREMLEPPKRIPDRRMSAPASISWESGSESEEECLLAVPVVKDRRKSAGPLTILTSPRRLR